MPLPHLDAYPLKRGLSLSLGLALTVLLATRPFAFAEEPYQMADNALYHFRQGQMWMAEGLYHTAAQSFQIGIRMNPSVQVSAALYNNLGLAYLQVQEYPKAIVSFQKAIALSPDTGVYYRNLVQAYTQSGGTQDALAQLTQAVSRDPRDPQAWFLLGQVYRVQARHDEARKAFSTFITLAPQSVLAQAAQDYITSPEEPPQQEAKVGRYP